MSYLPWPMTIIEAIYRRPGDLVIDKWYAFPCLPAAVPVDIFANSTVRNRWWKSSRAKVVGRGQTTEGAIQDLIERLDASGCKLWRDTEDGGWPV